MQVYILCFWSLSRQEAWKACIQYKCFICKTICRGEKKEVLLQTPKKSQRKCIWKISFSAEVHFLLLLSLFFAGINQSIIKPFFYHRIIKNQGVTWGDNTGTSSFQVSVIARLWHLLKKRTSKKWEMPRTSWWWLETPFALGSMQVSGMKGIISWKVIPHRGISN